MKPLHVAAAAIVRDGNILLSRRPEHLHQGGKWEFPGGKVEKGETVEQALARELEEELAIRPSNARQLIRVQHAYSDLTVLLDVWRVDGFSGTPEGLEGQEIQWFTPNDLLALEFPAANVPIVKSVLLPEVLDRSADLGFELGQDYLIWESQDDVQWSMFRAFTEQASLPVYLRSGSGAVSLEDIWRNGGQGLVSWAGDT